MENEKAYLQLISELTESEQLAYDNILRNIEQHYGKRPELDHILFLIGVQELGHPKKGYSKAQKQDLMHMAVCTLLSTKAFNFFTYSHTDEDGWKHYKVNQALPQAMNGLKVQENLLRRAIIQYFAVR